MDIRKLFSVLSFFLKYCGCVILKSMKKKTGKKRKSTSIESLAVMVQKGFAEQSRDFGEFKTGMVGFKADMLDFKQKTEKSLYNIDSKLLTVDKRLDSIEKTLGPLVHVVDALKVNYRDHETRISRLEHKFGVK